MRTFTFRDGKTWRFWNIDLQDTRCVVTSGPMYRKGRTQVREYADAGAARAAHDRMVRRKLAVGYVEITPPPVAPLRQALEAALVEDPDDLASHMAYADYLVEQGDPRGELIRTQLEHEQLAARSGRRIGVPRRALELVNEHGRDWLGELAPYLLEQSHTHAVPFRFVRGWLDTLYLENLTVDLARTVAHAPQVRLLSELRIDGVSYEPPGSYHPGDDTPQAMGQPSLAVLFASPHLSNLRRLHVRMDPLHFGAAAAVVYSPRLGRLTHLRLQTLSLVPDALEAVVSSGIIGRLRVLDLQGCGLTDLSADILARADLRGLELLNLDGNRLSDRGLRVLREAGAALQAGNQNRLDEADFYYLEQGEDEPFDEDWE